MRCKDRNFLAVELAVAPTVEVEEEVAAARRLEQLVGVPCLRAQLQVRVDEGVDEGVDVGGDPTLGCVCRRAASGRQVESPAAPLRRQLRLALAASRLAALRQQLVPDERPVASWRRLRRCAAPTTSDRGVGGGILALPCRTTPCEIPNPKAQEAKADLFRAQNSRFRSQIPRPKKLELTCFGLSRVVIGRDIELDRELDRELEKGRILVSQPKNTSQIQQSTSQIQQSRIQERGDFKSQEPKSRTSGLGRF